MITIRYRLNPDSYSLMKELKWLKGDLLPFVELVRFSLSDHESLYEDDLKVYSVYADGDELNYIVNNFQQIPIIKSSYVQLGLSCVWRGDLARFIFDNL